jgi:environmental stress-induced protein Ves
MDYGVRVLRFADYPVVPWRNGRGVTREIAAATVPLASTNRDPDGDDLPPLPAPTPAWRITMATVESDVPFSDYSGLVRVLGVVDGDGIELTVDGRMSRLRPGETHGPFAGGAPASARPLGGVTLDLGLIFDPARTRGELSAVGAGGRDIVGLIWFVVSLVDGLEVSLNGTQVATLARRDTAALDLRTGPIARLSLATADAAPGGTPGPLASAPLASAPAASAPLASPLASAPVEPAPVAYLVSIAP